MALPDRGIVDRTLLEGGEVLGALPVERDLGDDRQPGIDSLRREDRHAPLDDARVDQTLDPAQARGGRGVYRGREGLVRHRRVTLQQVQDAQIGGIEWQ